MAPQYFTITADGVYRSADGSKNYQFYQNDQIPMELAVELGIEGAALAEGEFFSSEEEAAIQTEAEALIEALIASRYPIVPAGTYLDMAYWATVATMGTQAVVNTASYHVPFFTPRAITIDRIAVPVTSGIGSSVVVLGAHAHNTATNGPGALLLDGGTAATDATAIAAVTVDLDLPAGWSWLSAHFSAAVTVRAYNSTNTSPWGVRTDLNTAPQPSVVITRAYDGTLADPAGTLTATSVAPRLAVRVAS